MASSSPSSSPTSPTPDHFIIGTDAEQEDDDQSHTDVGIMQDNACPWSTASFAAASTAVSIASGITRSESTSDAASGSSGDEASLEVHNELAAASRFDRRRRASMPSRTSSGARRVTCESPQTGMSPTRAMTRARGAANKVARMPSEANVLLRVEMEMATLSTKYDCCAAKNAQLEELLGARLLAIEEKLRRSSEAHTMAFEAAASSAKLASRVEALETCVSEIFDLQVESQLHVEKSKEYNTFTKQLLATAEESYNTFTKQKAELETRITAIADRCERLQSQVNRNRIADANVLDSLSSLVKATTSLEGCTSGLASQCMDQGLPNVQSNSAIYATAAALSEVAQHSKVLDKHISNVQRCQYEEQPQSHDISDGTSASEVQLLHEDRDACVWPAVIAPFVRTASKCRDFPRIQELAAAEQHVEGCESNMDHGLAYDLNSERSVSLSTNDPAVEQTKYGDSCSVGAGSAARSDFDENISCSSSVGRRHSLESIDSEQVGQICQHWSLQSFTEQETDDRNPSKCLDDIKALRRESHVLRLAKSNGSRLRRILENKTIGGIAKARLFPEKSLDFTEAKCPEESLPLGSFTANLKKIHVRRAQGVAVGLELRTNNFEVLQVKTGCFRDFNRSNPGSGLSVGDFVVEVNGRKGADDMAEELLRSRDLRVTVSQPTRSV